MGKWNRRWTPRKKYYQQTPPSPPTYYDTEYKFRAAWKNCALPWEERYCISVGIPWQKVAVAKNYVYCHDNVVKWNDSAGEETFCNAKKRFWAEINGLPCDDPLPDPNMYIDKIDWNPEIDPELMLELDRTYFNPDEAEKVDKVEITKREVHNLVPPCNSGWDDNNRGSSDNPWECKSNGALEDVAPGWGRWDNSTNENVYNPWERGNTQDDGVMKDNAWGGCMDKSWDRNQGLVNCTGQSQRLDDNCGNPLDHGGQSVGSVKERGWGSIGNGSCGWNHWETNPHELINSGYVDTHWETQVGGDPKNIRWKDCIDNSLNWQQWESQGNLPNHLYFRRHNGSGRGSNGGWRKREGYQQYTSRYKSSRFQAEDYGTVHEWRKQRTQNRVTFAFD